MKLIKSEKIEVTEIKEKRTFEYYVNGKRREYSMIAANEFWADEEMAMAFVKSQIEHAAQIEKGAQKN